MEFVLAGISEREVRWLKQATYQNMKSNLLIVVQ